MAAAPARVSGFLRDEFCEGGFRGAWRAGEHDVFAAGEGGYQGGVQAVVKDQTFRLRAGADAFRIKWSTFGTEFDQGHQGLPLLSSYSEVRRIREPQDSEISQPRVRADGGS